MNMLKLRLMRITILNCELFELRLATFEHVEVANYANHDWQPLNISILQVSTFSCSACTV